MFVLVNRNTLKLGSFFSTLADAHARLIQMGSVGASYGVMDVGDVPYETIDPKNHTFIEVV
jgi:hypothetical protein